MKKTKKSVTDNSHNNVTVMTKPNPKTPFSGKDRIKQIDSRKKAMKNIMDELGKS